ncbi:beta-glucosidase [Litchfieldia salsa]|uniref:Beta-glucosidase n=1 Tax=Litchfieldia salsa TaxID=930152 RepID=A0A1H0WAV0_9BACI|nr:glycoside hydrolase family 3 N-terminal domain-containing protein [Litchfieldia salsa]SDP87807.1 beta-glucosidase [Litchfieldia salsa]
MLKKVFLIVVFIILPHLSERAALASLPPQLTDKASINEVIKAMTLEEKVKMVVGSGMPGMFGIPKAEIEGAVGVTHAIPRLGIPALIFADGPAGLRINPIREGIPNTYYTTAFPIETLLASTWDTEMVEAVGSAIGDEAKEYGVDILLAPALNLHRNPLGGRNFEYFSEDPLLTGKMGASYVKGVQSQGVGATLKHFVANNQETNRMQIDTVVSQRALRELYLRGFEIAVKESKPLAVMSAYNQINGVPASENKELLTTILRKEWNFNGFVMTDWFAGKDPIAQMRAGNDLIMPGEQKHITRLIHAVKSGLLDEEILDRNIKHILKTVVKTPSFKGYEYSNQPNLEEHAQVARKVASEGMVLLKNDEKTLPLDKNAKIGLFGNTQIETIKGGTGSGIVQAKYTVSIAEGLEKQGFKLHQGLLSSYKAYVLSLRQLPEYKSKPGPLGIEFGLVTPRIPEKPIPSNELQDVVKDTDSGIITIGRISGEFEDRENEKGDFLLTNEEQSMIETVSEAYHQAGKKVTVVLNIGGPIEVASWREKVDSILLAWQPGQEAGHAVADILSGKVNPSGKLSTTFPMKYNDVPSAKSFPGTPKDNPKVVIYEEDLYLGYRYYTTFDVKPAYEFGYGLSYTSFHYENLEVEKKKNNIHLNLNVKNVGDVKGREVVQVYLTSPNGKLEEPLLELKAFEKTKELKPLEHQLVEFTLNLNDLASFDEKKSLWVVEKGRYKVNIGTSSESILQSTTFRIDEDIIVERVNDY